MCECTAYSDMELTVNHRGGMATVEAWEQWRLGNSGGLGTGMHAWQWGMLGNGGGLGMAWTNVLLMTHQ